MAKLKINGLMNDKDIAWKKCKCSCSTIKDDVENQHPIKKCTHCYCQRCEDSMPRETFKVNRLITTKDDDGKEIQEIKSKTVKEITIQRSTDGYNSILGWNF